MASYWKSPYKERTHSDALQAAFAGSDPLVPVSPQPYRGLSKAKHGGHISPQDWFDWAFVVNNNNGNSNSIRYHPANLRHARAELKGILKLPADESSVDDGRTGVDTESNESSRSELGCSKREKKRVTFDASLGCDAYNSIRFQPPTRSEPLNNRTKANNLMNGFPSKKSGGLSKLRRLPSVRAEGVSNKEDGQAESTANSGKCKHNPELRCASCFSSADPTKTSLEPSAEQTAKVIAAKEDTSQETSIITSVPVSGFSIPDSKPDSSISHSTQRLQQDSNKERTRDLPSEPLKKYKPHWVKTITPLQRKRQYLRQAVRQKLQTNDTSKKKDRERLGFVNPGMKNQELEHFSKLHISGDGKLVSTKLQDENIALRLQQNSHRHQKTSRNTPTLATNGRGVKTRPVGGSLPECPPLARGGSAPGRLREDRDSGQLDCLDKTSQILSWLNDVRSKSHFKSRTSRTYASGPTDLLS